MGKRQKNNSKNYEWFTIVGTNAAAAAAPVDLSTKISRKIPISGSWNGRSNVVWLSQNNYITRGDIFDMSVNIRRTEEKWTSRELKILTA